MNTYERNRDIEARLYDEEAYYEEEYDPRDFQDHDHDDDFDHHHHHHHDHDIQRGSDLQHILFTIQNNFDYSLKYNVIKLLISLGKIIAAIVVLAVATPCVDSKVNWIIAMLCHDVLYFSLVLTTIRLVLMVNQTLSDNARAQERRAAQQNQVHPANAQNDELAGQNVVEGQNIVEGQQENQLDNQIDTLHLAREITRRQKVIGRLSGSLEIIYFVIFIYGQLLLYIQVKPVCQSAAVDNLMITFIAMGFIWILSPVLILLLACLCFPVLVLAVLVFGRNRRGPAPANMALIDALEVKKFSAELPGNHECSICMDDYKQGDDLIQLKCSPLHHFHESCIKQWLKVNGQCPMCRKKLEEM